mmetsp:Transcript_37040/g.82340  ORF Transcript_37040/g.82340 Transcript_37040/m.82340 type:complete len:310 (+) Transcript_37040:95-1024(+)|eukprot:CAMPEP_0202895744 /NCGR_PEP_ID=MMETSP1392-20130828/4891_1 /ASSEMBLY_ACC=CAM_ASM_000868 /TAXON_ID=225041 /ORGANISM="Chlamydomonas chlamydogama, Strain SAG 11-48b" /LENGTH=309 /DNA_ID=CAMNT_0049580867 /DNA_START=83 /DNA_END=1012 /DNA_ORIENTATION=-
MTSRTSLRASAYDVAHRREHYRSYIMGMNAHERHIKFVNDYLKFYGNGGNASGLPSQGPVQTDLSALQQAHRFIRNEDDDAPNTWDVRLARRYYERLFKEYCIADLSRYKESKIGMRWRVQKEVISGKGQFVCGAKGCEERDGLCSYEVNFAYEEAGQKKQALVKLRVCPACAYKLNYKKEKQFRKAGGAAKHAAPGGQEGGSMPRKRGAEEQLLGSGNSKRTAGSNSRMTAAELIASLDAAADVEAAVKQSVAPPPARADAAPSSMGQPDAAAACVLPADDSVWEQKPAVEASTGEEDFEQYFEGMFV